MTDQPPVRACAIQEHATEKPRLVTLWETVPHFQVQLLQFVETSNAIDRAMDGYEDEDGLSHTLVWQDFTTMAAVDAANAMLHQERYFEELEWQLADPREPVIATLQQRLRGQRERYSRERFDNFLNLYRQQMLECLQRYLATKKGP